jgi:hypothetical protein
VTHTASVHFSNPAAANQAVASDAGRSPARLSSRSARRPAPLNRRGVGRRMHEGRLIFTLKDSPHFVRYESVASQGLFTVPPDTQALSLEGSNISDDELSVLPNLTALRCLDLDSTSITDRSLAKIATLPALEELWLEDTAVTDAGLRALHSASCLRFVSLAYTAVTESGIRSLREAIPGVVVA